MSRSEGEADGERAGTLRLNAPEGREPAFLFLFVDPQQIRYSKPYQLVAGQQERHQIGRWTQPTAINRCIRNAAGENVPTAAQCGYHRRE